LSSYTLVAFNFPLETHSRLIYWEVRSREQKIKSSFASVIYRLPLGDAFSISYLLRARLRRMANSRLRRQMVASVNSGSPSIFLWRRIRVSYTLQFALANRKSRWSSTVIYRLPLGELRSQMTIDALANSLASRVRRGSRDAIKIRGW